MTRKYTLSPAALAVRKAASKAAAEVRPPGRTWTTVKIDTATREAVAAQRKGREGLGATIRRKFGAGK